MPTTKPSKNTLAQLPQVDKLLKHPALEAWNHRLLPQVRKEVIRKILEEAREALKKQEGGPSEKEMLQKISEGFEFLVAPALSRAINATGIVLHTNLGRAPLGESSLQALAKELSGYCTLETDLETAGRGDRTTQLETMLCALTGAEAALVLNNGAAAVFLMLNALAAGKEVVISRSELVQIGGGFRMPDILKQSGAQLCEVGTTNITEISDYQKSVNEKTGLILKVHQSCFHITGHTHAPTLEALSALAHQHHLPLAVDWGSGSLKNRTERELSIQEILASDCDLLSFSGDKLFGSSQAGVVVGKRAWVSLLKKSPLYRALRLGKLDLFVLEDRVRAHLGGLPSVVDALLDVSLETLRQRSAAFSSGLTQAGLTATVSTGLTPIGGGSTPEESLESSLIKIKVADSEKAARKLAQFRVPIYVRKEKGAVVLDLRTVFTAEEPLLLEALRSLS